eukprot:5447616-Amphidinium_carterae.1
MVRQEVAVADDCALDGIQRQLCSALVATLIATTSWLSSAECCGTFRLLAEQSLKTLHPPLRKLRLMKIRVCVVVDVWVCIDVLNFIRAPSCYELLECEKHLSRPQYPAWETTEEEHWGENEVWGYDEEQAWCGQSTDEKYHEEEEEEETTYWDREEENTH